MEKYYLAIDIGASSGRHILGSLKEGRLVLEEVYRFENRQLSKNNHNCWDMDNLWKGIIGGMKACKEKGCIPATMGIDTWGVDFVLLDGAGEILGDAVAYRDSRTEGMDDAVEGLIPPMELYGRTGIQKQIFNTIYQLMALKKESPEQLERAESLLMIPDYFNYLLTGIKKQEYTNATTTGLVNAKEAAWDLELIGRLNFPEKLFSTLSLPGETVGPLSEAVAEEVGFQTTVVLPATHDTGSAFLAVPAKDENAVYLSSGTWSLLGMENDRPVTSEESLRCNFTNEGGAWHRYRYLKNIMGLWMIQSIRRELNGTAYVEGQKSKYASGREWSFPDLIEEAKKAQEFASVVDANDSAFLAPDSMIDAVKSYCASSGQAVPESVGEIMRCVYLSLAKCYGEGIKELSHLTGRTFSSINIVGGGCQDMYLNEMTAKATGLTVYAGPVEGTAIGNLLVQMIAAGDFDGLKEARECIRKSFEIKEIE